MPLIIGSIAETLKSRTSLSHACAERSLLEKLEAIRSNADYVAILKMFYGFFFPLQQSIACHITTKHLNDIKERRQASLIIHDLQSLGSPVQNIPLCTHLPEIENATQAFGALYVMEGATLGGRIIARMLLHNSYLKLSEENLSFFNGYREATAMKWKAFQQALDKELDQELLIDTAKETFLLFHNWINT